MKLKPERKRFLVRNDCIINVFNIFHTFLTLKIENDLSSLLLYFEALINSLKNRLEAKKKSDRLDT